MLSPDAPESQYVMESTDQDFMTDVIEASNTQPVLVDFWAPWCGPCRTLTPILEKTVNSYAGRVKLVKINTEAHPAIAGQMGVRSIPAVFAFDKGRPVNGFQGALPEGQVRQFIDKVLDGTDGAQQLKGAIEQAEQAQQSGDIATAAQLFAAVLEADPQNIAAIAGLARCYLTSGDAERARQILMMAPEDRQLDPAIKSVYTALDMMAESPLDEDLMQAQQQVANNPQDHAARFALAETLAASGQQKAASEHLLTILEAELDWQDGKARAKLLDIFEAAGPKDPITVAGRRKLGSLMFS